MDRPRGGMSEDAHRPKPDEAPVDEVVEALLEGDQRRAETLVLEVLDDRGRFQAVMDELVQPAMEEIGRRWADGEVSVSDEHLATAIMETVLARAHGETDLGNEEVGRALLACVEGNRHALGLRGLSDALEIEGWQTRYLGADVPTEALVDHVERWEPDLVCLSVSLAGQIPAAREVIGRIHNRFGDRGPRVLLGGLAVDTSAGKMAAGPETWMGSASAALEALA